jgi:eukaryotic-like serine/threonine-protein kinase
MEIINSRYQILGELGQGGIGTTYNATDVQNNQLVAAKIISFRQIKDWKTVDLFEREVRVLKQLNHPSIPKYLDSFEIEEEGDRLFCIVQELAAGKNLSQWMQEGWRPNEETVKTIAQQLLETLIYLQALTPPIIHRDIKPQNILRDEQGHLFLVDFGAVQDTYRQTVTGGSTVVGTFGYMAPEQFRGQATLATDLYGLGTTLVFLLTGKDPINLHQTEDLKIIIPSDIKISFPFRRWIQTLIEPAVEERCTSAVAAMQFFKGQEPVFSRSRAFLRPQKTKIQLVKSENYLRIQFLPTNFLCPRVVKSTLIGLIAIIYFVFLSFWTTVIGFRLSDFINLSLTLPFLSLTAAVLVTGIRALQTLVRPTILILNEQYLTLKGVIRPFHFYQEVTFGIEYIDEIRLNRSAQKTVSCLIKTVGQDKFQFGDFLSAAEQYWILQEVQDFIHLIKSNVSSQQQKQIEQLKDKKLTCLDELLMQGIHFYKIKSVQKSRVLFESAIILEPTCAEAHNNLGVVLLEEQRCVEAIESFHLALSLAPSYWTARVNLANSYEKNKDFQRSIKTYITPCATDKRKGEDKYTLSVFSDTRMSLADIMDDLQKLNPSGETTLDIKESYAFLLYLQGNSEASICAYQDALKFANKNTLTLEILADRKTYQRQLSKYYSNFGWILAMSGRYKEALGFLKRSAAGIGSQDKDEKLKISAFIEHYQKLVDA